MRKKEDREKVENSFLKKEKTWMKWRKKKKEIREKMNERKMNERKRKWTWTWKGVKKKNEWKKERNSKKWKKPGLEELGPILRPEFVFLNSGSNI